VFERVWSLAALVALGLAVFFAVAFVTGAVDREVLAMLRRRRAAPEPVAGSAAESGD
jgi:putative peptidoglycan lipid II flippase